MCIRDSVPGVEISCERGGRSVHLLGYLVDPAYDPLAAELAKARDSRVTRLERMVALLAADGIPPVSYTQLDVYKRQDEGVGADLLVEQLLGAVLADVDERREG